MKLVFIDSGAFYALTDARDPEYKIAKKFYQEYRGTFLTTAFVFAETMSLLTKRLGKQVAVQVGEGIRQSPRFRIDEIDFQVREQAWQLFSSRKDKKYDLIDCLSFAVMESFGIDQAFGFDRHFVQHGFKLMPDVKARK